MQNWTPKFWGVCSISTKWEFTVWYIIFISSSCGCCLLFLSHTDIIVTHSSDRCTSLNISPQILGSCYSLTDIMAILHDINTLRTTVVLLVMRQRGKLAAANNQVPLFGGTVLFEIALVEYDRNVSLGLSSWRIKSGNVTESGWKHWTVHCQPFEMCLIVTIRELLLHLTFYIRELESGGERWRENKTSQRGWEM